MERTYKLKWLNGPLSGRELALPSGELRLGGADSDIALNLEHDAQATLLIEDAAIRLVSATPIWVEGRHWDREQVLPLGSVIDIAGQAIVLGIATDELLTQGVPARLGRGPVRGAHWSFWCAGATACVVVALTAGLMFWRPTPTVTTFDLDMWLATQLNDPELYGLSVERDVQGGLLLKGICRSSTGVEGLRLRLREKGLYLYDESVCADTLRKSVRSVLTLNGYRDVEVKSAEVLDRVVIFGNIVADRAWQRASTQLRAIQTLGGWTVVNDHVQLFNDLLASLAAQSLLAGLSISVSDNALRVSGQLESLRFNAVTDVLDAFNRKGSPRLLATFQNIPGAPPANQYLPATIVGIGGNADSPYVQLANGMRLQEGSVLPSGYLIYALSRSTMALLKGQELISLSLEL